MSEEVLPPDVKRPRLDDSAAAETVVKDSAGEVTPMVVLEEKSGEVIQIESKQIREEDVGITEYISGHSGFHGIIKQRYSDFLVHEISETGEVIHLTNTDPPVLHEGLDQEGVDVSDILTQEQIEKLTQLRKEKAKDKSVKIEVGEDKNIRTKIHRAIAVGFPGLDTATVTEGDQKFIKAMLGKPSDRGRHYRAQWPKERGDFLKFVMYKENIDTMDTISLIARNLRMKAGNFHYAGTKDKRAKTSQEVTVYRVVAEKMIEVNKKLRNIVLGNFRYVKSALKLGMSKGNKFIIVLRDVTGEDDQIHTAMTSLRDVGFINYYGMQRFGTQSVPTHHVGRALLCGRWQEAAGLIMKPRTGESADATEARKIWWNTRNAEKAVRLLQGRMAIERALLEGLQKHGDNNYANAIQSLPRNSRLMYIHAYQSYIWNSVASRRVCELGLKPVPGDLFLQETVVTEREDDSESSDFQIVQPSVVDEENVNSVHIQDVVLPLPGYTVIYPQNTVGEWYQSILKEEGLEEVIFKTKNSITTNFDLRGAYRRLLIKPGNVRWEVMRYDDVTVPLALSDWEKMQGHVEPKFIQDGKCKALKLEMTLPPASYATMALREVLKSDTSKAHQTSLNQPIRSDKCTDEPGECDDKSGTVSLDNVQELSSKHVQEDSENVGSVQDSNSAIK